MAKLKEKSLVGWTHINFSPDDLLSYHATTENDTDIFIDGRFFHSKKKALNYWNCYDNEIKQIRITIEEIK